MSNLYETKEDMLRNEKNLCECVVCGYVYANKEAAEQCEVHHVIKTRTRQDTINEILKKLPEEKDIGNNTYYNTCKGHQAAGECDCHGYNQCLQEAKKLLEGLK